MFRSKTRVRGFGRGETMRAGRGCANARVMSGDAAKAREEGVWWDEATIGCGVGAQMCCSLELRFSAEVQKLARHHVQDKAPRDSGRSLPHRNAARPQPTSTIALLEPQLLFSLQIQRFSLAYTTVKDTRPSRPPCRTWSLPERAWSSKILERMS